MMSQYGRNHSAIVPCLGHGMIPMTSESRLTLKTRQPILYGSINLDHSNHYSRGARPEHPPGRDLLLHLLRHSTHVRTGGRRFFIRLVRSSAPANRPAFILPVPFAPQRSVLPAPLKESSTLDRHLGSTQHFHRGGPAHIP